MDQTEGGTPGAGGQLSGEASRQAAIKRMEQEQGREFKLKKKSGGTTPSSSYGGPPKP